MGELQKAAEKRGIDAEENRPLPLSYIDRYSRQMVVKEVGLEGQRKIKDARVLVVGAGGLGAPVLMYLAAMGVGCIGVADSDAVEDSNLNRQILYKEASVGQAKTAEAVSCLRALASSARYRTHPKIAQSNVWEIGAAYDLVMDCGDSRSLRYLLSDYSRTRGIPYIGGSSLRWEGHVYVLNKLCYRCVYPSASKYFSGSCSSAGILGSMCGLVGSVMATEAMKEILGVSRGDLLLYSNGLKGDFMNISLVKEKCRVCKVSRGMTLPEVKRLVAEEALLMEEADANAGSCLVEGLAGKMQGVRIEARRAKGFEGSVPVQEIAQDGLGCLKALEADSLSESAFEGGGAEEGAASAELGHAQAQESSRKGCCAKSAPGLQEVEWSTVLARRAEYFVVDVRPAAEQRILPIPGTYLCALSDLVDNPKKAYLSISKRAKNRQVALCCRNGATSRRFASLFNAANISGGSQAYAKHRKSAAQENKR